MIARTQEALKFSFLPGNKQDLSARNLIAPRNGAHVTTDMRGAPGMHSTLMEEDAFVRMGNNLHDENGCQPHRSKLSQLNDSLAEREMYILTMLPLAPFLYHLETERTCVNRPRTG